MCESITDGDVFLISFPKSGRTWLRFLLGKVLVLHFEIKNVDLLLLHDLASVCSDIPSINITHDDDPCWKKPQELSVSKTEYTGKKVIFLVRDPRDIIVSYYFEKTRREQMYYMGDREFKGKLSSFVQSEIGSLKTLIAFYNIWAENQHIPLDFLIVCYEDMQKDTKRELLNILKFINIHETSDQAINQAIQYASFENMRQLEIKGVIQSFILRPGNENDPESYKTRRGKIGGFLDYLGESEIKWMDSIINEELSSLYEYYKYKTLL